MVDWARATEEAVPYRSWQDVAALEMDDETVVEVQEFVEILPGPPAPHPGSPMTCPTCPSAHQCLMTISEERPCPHMLNSLHILSEVPMPQPPADLLKDQFRWDDIKEREPIHLELRKRAAGQFRRQFPIPAALRPQIKEQILPRMLAIMLSQTSNLKIRAQILMGKVIVINLRFHRLFTLNSASLNLSMRTDQVAELERMQSLRRNFTINLASCSLSMSMGKSRERRTA